MAERQWTPAQKNAIEADSGTVLVSAAAGSGKTSVLTQRIIRKLTAGENAVRPESLLVVTFTNAAAAEMRSRIYSGICALKAKHPERRDEIVSLLAVLGEMQVCTMDSFSMNLVKENCHALGIDSDFTMLERGQSNVLKKKAAVSVLERRFTENADTFLLLAKMFESGRNDSRLISTVIKLSDFSMSEADPAAWLRSLYELYDSPSAQESVWGKYLADEVLGDLCYCLQLSDAAVRDIETDEVLVARYLPVYKKENELIRKAVSDMENAPWDKKNSLVRQLCDTLNDKISLTVPRDYTNNPMKLSAQTKRNTIKKVLKSTVGYFSITEAENASDLPLLKAVARELSETVQAYNEELLSYKKEMSAYDFSDIAHFALKLLYDSSAEDKKTDLARELTKKYSEILIDEYQDTNRAQDTLFHSVSDDGKNMFFVGDVKQSIYRFRLASPEIFIEKCNEFPYYDGTAEKSKIILGHNFRSRKGILDGVNFIFSRLMTPECGDIEYNDDERLNFPEGANPEPTTDVSLAVLEDKYNDAELTEAEYVVGVIKEYLENGVSVSDGGQERCAQPSDFCILMRSPSGSAHIYIKALEKAGIPVSSDVNISFFETPEIKTVMSYLRVLDNPARDTDMLAVMLSPLFGFTPDDVAQLRIAYGKKASLYANALQGAGSGDKKCELLCRKLDFFRRLAACASIGEVLREIYDDSAYPLAAGAMKDGDGRRRNLMKLLQRAEAAGDGNSTLGSFVRYMDVLRENGADIAGSAGAGGVKIMSMHKSKGLEFPFVFIAGSTGAFNKTDINQGLVINHKAGLGIKIREPEKIKSYDTLSSYALKRLNSNELVSEELRVYYVALTRAKQKLFITMALHNRDKTIGDIANLMQGLEAVPPYVVKHSSDAARWLLCAFMLHPEASALMGYGGFKSDKVKSLEITLADTHTKVSEASQPEEEITADEETVELIRKKAAFTYKWAEVAAARSKHTASSAGEGNFDSSSFARSVPAFMFASALSPVDVGTATHKFLQFCDFDACKASVADECERLVKNGRLTEKQAAVVDEQAIRGFVCSEIFERAEKSRLMLREKQFTMAKSICELDDSISKAFVDEKTVIIGKIDLLFIEDDGAVIVDYKTDNITDINELASRYHDQMELYSEALGKSMGLKVKECILYSLRLKDSIALVL